MVDFGVDVGEAARFAKTVGETDVYLFAGLSGDFAPNHVNEEYMKATAFGRRMAHGGLLLAFASTASTIIAGKSLKKDPDYYPVSVGYDRIRFLKPVFIGDTVTVIYTVVELMPDRERARSKIETHNQRGELVMVGEHILQWVKSPRHQSTSFA